MKNISCCFTGHRDINPADIPVIRNRLNNIIESLIEKGFTEFYTGGARGFDMLAAYEVLSLKEKYPSVHLYVIIPCRDQTKNWRESDKKKYGYILSCADDIVCLTEKYFNGCMQIRNRYMVNRSSIVVAYLTRSCGGSAGTVKYAAEQGLRVINIAEEISFQTDF